MDGARQRETSDEISWKMETLVVCFCTSQTTLGETFISCSEILLNENSVNVLLNETRFVLVILQTYLTNDND